MAGDAHPDIVRLQPAGLAPAGGHYSHGVVANGMVFISGQLPITPEGQRLSDAPFAVQAQQVLDNVRATLLAAGCDVGHLLQVRVYLDDVAHWPEFNTLYAAWAGAARPARAVVPTAPLHFGLKIEIEAVALAPR
ncbi:MAG TPA: RidA family protein [Burkholderiaceae bacterium]|jgi:reactive intermediate/imine deaminase